MYRETDAAADRCEKIAVSVPDGIPVVIYLRFWLRAAPLDIHVTEVRLGSQKQPVPLEIIADRSAGHDARLIITPWPGLWTGCVKLIGVAKNLVFSEVDGFCVTELSTDHDPEIKSGPIALDRRGRDFFHFFAARHRLGSGAQRRGERGTSTEKDRQAR